MSASRARRIALSFILSFSAVAGVVPAASAAEAPLPDTMAAVGDSISQAASSAGSLGADAPQNSWSTGTSSTVNSHYLRLLAAGAPISGRNYNRSVSGAKVADLATQMANAATLQPDYLTVLIGGNDLCTDTVGAMTSEADFRARFQAAMATLNSRSPSTYVYVVSIPNVYQLWQLFKGDFWGRFIWSIAGICQSLLANPTSTASTDVARRETVRQRNIAFNSALADICLQFDRCLFDGNAVFNTPFTRADVSGDYFHPSVAGQAKLAATTWNAGFTFGTAPPPPPPDDPPVAGFNVSCDALACTFGNASSADATEFAWDFGDGGTSTEANPSHTYAAADTYVVSLTVADAAGQTDAASQTLTVSGPQPTVTMRVASFTATSASTGKNTWTATGHVSIGDSNGRAPDGATVTVSWSSGSASCVTVSGACVVTTENLNRRKVSQVTLTVTGVALDGVVWDGAPASATATLP